MIIPGVPRCVPVITREKLHQTDSLPRYLVRPGNLLNYLKPDLKREEMRIKIIGLGEGSLS
jgi:hypothetical protein